MAGNIQLPLDLTKVIQVTYTPELLQRFLVDLLNRVTELEQEVQALQTKVGIKP